MTVGLRRVIATPDTQPDPVEDPARRRTSGWPDTIPPCGRGCITVAQPARIRFGVDFCILGPLEVLDEGRAVPLGGSKQRALLALLLLHANKALTTHRLMEELWHERPPPTAAKNVQMHVSRLRKALATGAAGDLVVTRERGYELKIDPEQLDASRFESLFANGRSELAAGHPESALAALESALSLWRGEPLADLAYAPFAQSEIARLKDLRVGALEQLIEAKLMLAGHAEVIANLETLIAEHPYRERLRAQLMLALYRCDRQADALQVYQDTRRTLVDELGIEPGERLRELERSILAQDPRLQLTVVAKSPTEPAGGIRRSGFVARERDPAEVAEGPDDAIAGPGRMFLLGGEPGIGKSRPADELMAHARMRGTATLEIDAYSAAPKGALNSDFACLQFSGWTELAAAIEEWRARIRGDSSTRTRLLKKEDPDDAPPPSLTKERPHGGGSRAGRRSGDRRH